MRFSNNEKSTFRCHYFSYYCHCLNGCMCFYFHTTADTATTAATTTTTATTTKDYKHQYNFYNISVMYL